MAIDAFISHATEDKEPFVNQLASNLSAAGYSVWFDKFSLKLGDSIRRSIDYGLAHSRYGIVVLSRAFFRKNWPQYELDGLVQRENSVGQKVILPVWHGVDHALVSSYSLSLADALRSRPPSASPPFVAR